MKKKAARCPFPETMLVGRPWTCPKCGTVWTPGIVADVNTKSIRWIRKESSKVCQ